jgi:hypothetical protein
MAQLLESKSAAELQEHMRSVADITVKALNDPAVAVRNKGKQVFARIARYTHFNIFASSLLAVRALESFLALPVTRC